MSAQKRWGNGVCASTCESMTLISAHMLYYMEYLVSQGRLEVAGTSNTHTHTLPCGSFSLLTYRSLLTPITDTFIAPSRCGNHHLCFNTSCVIMIIPRLQHDPHSCHTSAVMCWWHVLVTKGHYESGWNGSDFGVSKGLFHPGTRAHIVPLSLGQFLSSSAALWLILYERFQTFSPAGDSKIKTESLGLT